MHSESENLEIDPDFEAALRPLSDEEFRQLENNILAAGKIIDPIVVWGNKIIDGLNRYKIALKHSLAFDVVRLDFAAKEEALKWIHRNQIGRRNLAGIGLIKTRAAIAAALEEEDGQSLVAEALHISPRTLRDNKRTSAILQTVPKDIEKMLESGEIKATTKDLRQLADIPIESRKPIYDDWLVTKSLRDAIACNRSGVSAEQLEELVARLGKFVAVVNRIRSGAIRVSKADVDRFLSMPDGTQQLVGCILLGDIGSLKEAMDTLNASSGITLSDRLRRSAAEIRNLVKSLCWRIKQHSEMSGVACDDVAGSIERSVEDWLKAKMGENQFGAYSQS